MNPNSKLAIAGAFLLFAMPLLVHADPYYDFYGLVGRAIGGGGTSIRDLPAADGGSSGGAASPTILPKPAVNGCGDICVPHDGYVDKSDLDCLINYTFSGAAAPIPLWIADINGDGLASDVMDVTYMINHINRDGPGLECDPSKFGITAVTTGTITNPTDTSTTITEIIPELQQKIILHRTVRDCRTGTAFGSEQVFPVGPGTKYANYRCISRKQEQCFDDGSFDAYYDEWCTDASGEMITVVIPDTPAVDIPPLPDGSVGGVIEVPGETVLPDIGGYIDGVLIPSIRPTAIPEIGLPTIPARPICRETDAGANYYVKGTASDGRGSRIDSCSGRLFTE